VKPRKEMRSALPWCYNARTVVPVTERPQNLAQIEKLLSSPYPHGSESLCKLLRYLGSHSWIIPVSSPKEYPNCDRSVWAPEDFDPHLDSWCVSSGGLAYQVDEYYASEGQTTRSWWNCPKAPTACFPSAPPRSGRNHTNASHEGPNPLQVNGRTSRTWIVTVVALSVVLGSAVAVHGPLPEPQDAKPAPSDNPVCR